MEHTSNVAIEVSHLTKVFKKFTAVNNITFQVKKGEIFAFLGPNGAGKTTTIKMLTTLLSPSSGTLLVNNYSVSTEKNDVRRSFGIVFQDPSVDDELTAFENMELHAALYKIPAKERKSRIQKLLEFVDLWSRKNDFVKTFSGGMKRRLEIARGLLHTPAVLFLDEPTLGLDPQTRNHMWEYIKNVNKESNMTVFFTTHYLEEAEKIADRIAIIDHGAIIAQGTAKELREQTKTDSLEDAFLSLTGKAIREEEATGMMSHMRLRMNKRMGR